jgi:hypothetical protein
MSELAIFTPGTPCPSAPAEKVHPATRRRVPAAKWQISIRPLKLQPQTNKKRGRTNGRRATPPIAMTAPQGRLNRYRTYMTFSCPGSRGVAFMCNICLSHRQPSKDLSLRAHLIVAI